MTNVKFKLTGKCLWIILILVHVDAAFVKVWKYVTLLYYSEYTSEF